MTILTNNFQSAKVLLNTIHTKLFKKEITHLKEDTRTLFKTIQSTELFLEKVQPNINSFKERLNTLEKKTADLAHDINLFRERFSTLKKEMAELACKTQSMTVGAKTLFERIHTVDCINQTLSKRYDRLNDRMSLQEGNIHAIKTIFKNKILFLMDRLHTLDSSMRTLEQNTGQEIQNLQKAVVNRFKKIEEIIDFDDQEQKVRRKNLTLSVCKTLRVSFPRVLPAFPVITFEKVDSSKYPKVI